MKTLKIFSLLSLLLFAGNLLGQNVTLPGQLLWYDNSETKWASPKIVVVPGTAADGQEIRVYDMAKVGNTDIWVRTSTGNYGTASPIYFMNTTLSEPPRPTVPNAGNAWVQAQERARFPSTPIGGQLYTTSGTWQLYDVWFKHPWAGTWEHKQATRISDTRWDLYNRLGTINIDVASYNAGTGDATGKVNFSGTSTPAIQQVNFPLVGDSVLFSYVTGSIVSVPTTTGCQLIITRPGFSAVTQRTIPGQLFGRQTVEVPATPITVNFGAHLVTGVTVNISGDNDFGISTTSPVITSNAGTFDITFTPSSPGLKTATVTLSGTWNGRTFTSSFAVSGVGAAAATTLPAALLWYDNSNTKWTSPKIVVASNEDADCTIRVYNMTQVGSSDIWIRSTTDGYATPAHMYFMDTPPVMDGAVVDNTDNIWVDAQTDKTDTWDISPIGGQLYNASREWQLYDAWFAIATAGVYKQAEKMSDTKWNLYDQFEEAYMNVAATAAGAGGISFTESTTPALALVNFPEAGDYVLYSYDAAAIVPEPTRSSSVSITRPGFSSESARAFPDKAYNGQLINTPSGNVTFNFRSYLVNNVAVSISGTNASDFELTTSANPTITNNTGSFNIRYTPSALGLRTATVTIKGTYNSIEFTSSFTVSGYGTPAGTTLPGTLVWYDNSVTQWASPKIVVVPRGDDSQRTIRVYTMTPVGNTDIWVRTTTTNYGTSVPMYFMDNVAETDASTVNNTLNAWVDAHPRSAVWTVSPTYGQMYNTSGNWQLYDVWLRHDWSTPIGGSASWANRQATRISDTRWERYDRVGGAAGVNVDASNSVGSGSPWFGTPLRENFVAHGDSALFAYVTTGIVDAPATTNSQIIITRPGFSFITARDIPNQPFGEQMINESSAPVTIDFGSYLVSNVEVSISGDNEAEFALSTTSPTIAGNVGSFDITFTPTSVGLKTATVTISGTYNASNFSSVFEVSGEGTPNTGIKNDSYKKGSIFEYGNSVVVKVAEPSNVRIFSGQGLLITNEFVTDSFDYTLNPGMYIIMIDEVSYKFVKK